MTRFTQYKTGFVTLLAVSLAAGWRPLLDTLALSVRDDQDTYLLLIVPVSAALIFLEWRSLGSWITLNDRAGPLLLALALLIAVGSFGWSGSLPPDVRLSIRMIALVLEWIGAFVLCFGSRASRAVLFPLCFLVGLVPLPQFVLNGIVAGLQLGSAWAAHALFALSGVPVIQDGVQVTIPGLTLHVAQECSSIRSSSMLLVTTMVLAQLLLRSPWRKILLIALAVPLSVAKNGLRIFTIAMLGTRVDPGYLTGKLHHEGGSIFFAIVLAGIYGLLWILRRGENPSLKSGASGLLVKAT